MQQILLENQDLTNKLARLEVFYIFLLTISVQKHRQFRKQVPRQERISQDARIAAQMYHENMRAMNQDQEEYMI